MKRILVVNDSQELLELFRTLLTEEGYEVVMYSYALEDIREIEHIKPDLIILDIFLGSRKTAEWDMLEKLRFSRATASTPIIICTAAVDEAREQESYLTAHGIILILKPFDIDDLLNGIQKALQISGQ